MLFAKFLVFSLYEGSGRDRRISELPSGVIFPFPVYIQCSREGRIVFQTEWMVLFFISGKDAIEISGLVGR